MTIPAISGLGLEWQIPGVGSVGGVDPATDASGVAGLSGPAGTGPSGDFGGMLAQQIDNLSQMQDDRRHRLAVARRWHRHRRLLRRDRGREGPARDAARRPDPHEGI